METKPWVEPIEELIGRAKEMKEREEMKSPVTLFNEEEKHDKLESMQERWDYKLSEDYDEACEEYLMARYKLVKAHKDFKEGLNLTSEEWASADKDLAFIIVDPKLPEH